VKRIARPLSRCRVALLHAPTHHPVHRHGSRLRRGARLLRGEARLREARRHRSRRRQALGPRTPHRLDGRGHLARARDLGSAAGERGQPDGGTRLHFPRDGRLLERLPRARLARSHVRTRPVGGGLRDGCRVSGSLRQRLRSDREEEGDLRGASRRGRARRTHAVHLRSRLPLSTHIARPSAGARRASRGEEPYADRMGDADETRAHRAEALLEDSLAATLDILRELKDSPVVRDLRARAETYRRTIARWEGVRPSHEQRGALRELVLQLHGRALDLAEGGGKSPAPSSREE
jgi:hypothetical protein